MSQQQSSLGPPVPENSISIVLLSRGDGSFHWALGLAISDRPFAFRKLHATQLNGPGWEFEDVVHDIAQLKARKPVCVVVQIGSIGDTDTSDRIAHIVSKIPMVLPEREQKEDTFTCRVWLREALHVLRDNGLIYFPNIVDLEKEFISLGEDNDMNVVEGGPYKIYRSRFYKQVFGARSNVLY